MRSFISVLTACAIALGAGNAAAGDPERGKELSAACVQCHGEHGVSATGDFPIIAGQYASYLERALKDYKSGARENAIMQGIVAELSEQDMEDLAAYYAEQEGLSAINTLD